jgi:hypothetical protein
MMRKYSTYFDFKMFWAINWAIDGILPYHVSSDLKVKLSKVVHFLQFPLLCLYFGNKKEGSFG